METNNLLVICNTFPDISDKYIGSIFIKEQLNYLKYYFDDIYVLAPAPFGIEYKRKTRHVDYEFDNVHVFFPRYINNPLFYLYGRDFWIYLENKAICKFLINNKIKFNIIHAHYTWPAGKIAINIKKETNVPVVITEHSSDTFHDAANRRDPNFVVPWKQCDAIIRVRKGDINLFNSCGIDLKKVHYIPNGFDGKKFYKMESEFCREKLNLPYDKKIILNIANLYDECKGHRYLIESIDKILKYDKNAICLIIGEGRLRKNLENQIKRLGIEDNIKLLGNRSHDEIPIWINACDIFVLPSLNEGNPTVMFECLGCEKPFIGTSVGGIPEIINSNDYGLLCKPADSSELGRLIKSSLAREWDYDKIGKYSKQFTWKNIAKETMRVYESI